MAILDEVVFALRPVWITTHAPQLAQPGEALPRPSQQLVDVGLMTGVPEDAILGAAKDAMQRQG